jgi:hypothetical protein
MAALSGLFQNSIAKDKWYRGNPHSNTAQQAHHSVAVQCIQYNTEQCMLHKHHQRTDDISTGHLPPGSLGSHCVNNAGAAVLVKSDRSLAWLIVSPLGHYHTYNHNHSNSNILLCSRIHHVRNHTHAHTLANARSSTPFRTPSTTNTTAPLPTHRHRQRIHPRRAEAHRLLHPCLPRPDLLRPNPARQHNPY